MQELILKHLDALILVLLTALGVYLKQKPERIGQAINFVFLLPFNRHSVKFIPPLEHPLFSKLMEFRDIKSRHILWEEQKQKAWEIYVSTFYATMYLHLETLCKTEKLNQLPDQSFDQLLSRCFIEAYAEFTGIFMNRITLPHQIMSSLQSFDRDQIEQIDQIVGIWQDDNRFSEANKGNEIMIYNFFNHLITHFDGHFRAASAVFSQFEKEWEE